MEIEKVGGVPQPLRQETEGAESKTGKLSEKEKKDSLVVSAETKKIYEYVEMIKRMPGVREEKVKAVKEKIVKGEYQSAETMEEVVEKILKDLF